MGEQIQIFNPIAFLRKIERSPNESRDKCIAWVLQSFAVLGKSAIAPLIWMSRLISFALLLIHD